MYAHTEWRDTHPHTPSHARGPALNSTTASSLGQHPTHRCTHPHLYSTTHPSTRHCQLKNDDTAPPSGGGGQGAAAAHTSPHGAQRIHRCGCQGIAQLLRYEGPSKGAGSIGLCVCTALVVQRLVLGWGGCPKEKAIPRISIEDKGAGAAGPDVDSRRLRLLDGVERRVARA